MKNNSNLHSSNKFIIGTSILGFCFILGSLILVKGFNLKTNTTSTVEATVENGKYECTRKEPYKMEPEFERALSLRNQRIQAYFGTKKDSSSQNCIFIQYDDLATKNGEGTEGMFLFDKKSRLDKMTIYVDNSYKDKDDILTAILLQHELTHVSHFIDELSGKDKLSCVDDEVYSFMGQAYFLATLNSEEKKSIQSRLERYSNIDSITYDGLVSLMAMSNQSHSKCAVQYKPNSEQLSQCEFLTLQKMVESYVRSNPAYQDQCKLN